VVRVEDEMLLVQTAALVVLAEAPHLVNPSKVLEQQHKDTQVVQVQVVQVVAVVALEQ
jgi:hypothetical protein